MEKLARIEARLESLGELSELVGALRSMAAARAREAQEASAGTKQYCAIVGRAIQEISPLAAGCGLSAENAPDEGAVLLVITAENGFVGGFNNRLIETALEARRPEERLFIVGRRGQIAALERDIKADAPFAMTSRRDGVTPLARRIGKHLSNTAGARIVFARSTSGANYDIEVRQVLPLHVPEPSATNPLDAPLHHLPPSELLEGLAAEYLFGEIANALMQSLASENAARLRTMDAASRNIDDRLRKLEGEERAARQEETTSDMLDVVTGAEALSRA